MILDKSLLNSLKLLATNVKVKPEFFFSALNQDVTLFFSLLSFFVGSFAALCWQKIEWPWNWCLNFLNEILLEISIGRLIFGPTGADMSFATKGIQIYFAQD